MIRNISEVHINYISYTHPFSVITTKAVLGMIILPQTITSQAFDSQKKRGRISTSHETATGISRESPSTFFKTCRKFSKEIFQDQQSSSIEITKLLLPLLLRWFVTKWRANTAGKTCNMSNQRQSYSLYYKYCR